MTHSYTYNAAGQVTADTVTSFGSSGLVDQRVNEIDRAYTDLGQLCQVTSCGLVDGSETVLNQVEYAYDGWGNETCEWQALTGAVDTSAARPAYNIHMQSPRLPGEGARVRAARRLMFVRLTDVIYPNGRDVSYGYGRHSPTFGRR